MIKVYNKYLEKISTSNTTSSLYDALEYTSDKFWKMTEVADWQDFIIQMKKPETKFSEELEKVQGRIFKNFEHSEIKIFKKEYDILYDYLFTIFYQTHPVDENGKKIYIGDDAYTDLISSIIAFGKDFIKNAIMDKNIIKDMILKENYYENFSYILRVGKENYHNIRCKYDPIYRDASKYNL